MLPSMGGEREKLGAVRVLLVEDDRASAMVVQGHLAAIASVHCELRIATTLCEALAELRAQAVAAGAYDFLLKGQLADGSLERPVRLAALQGRTLESLRRSEERFRGLTA